MLELSLARQNWIYLGNDSIIKAEWWNIGLLQSKDSSSGLEFTARGSSQAVESTTCLNYNGWLAWGWLWLTYVYCYCRFSWLGSSYLGSIFQTSFKHCSNLISTLWQFHPILHLLRPSRHDWSHHCNPSHLNHVVAYTLFSLYGFTLPAVGSLVL